MEATYVPGRVSATLGKSQADYKEFMRKVEKKHQEFMKWMQKRHEEFMHKMMQQIPVQQKEKSWLEWILMRFHLFEATYTPCRFSGFMCKFEAEYKKLIEELQEKYEEFMQWMQSSHEEFMQKIANQEEFQEDEREIIRAGEGFSSDHLSSTNLLGERTGQGLPTFVQKSLSRRRFGKKFQSPTQLSFPRRRFGETRSLFGAQSFGTTITSAFCSTWTAVCGTTTPIFGRTISLAFGTPNSPATGVSSIPSFRIDSSPFGQSSTTFVGASTPTSGFSSIFGGTTKSSPPQNSAFLRKCFLNYCFLCFKLIFFVC
ncbi:hypothetical protein SUGI_0364570 [Cryptomeria japonica]|nr:hypothetical protein SUGI_0364570 [Cryptomeria japonica]